MEIAMSKASTGSLAAHLNDFVLNAKALRGFMARHKRARQGARAMTRLDDYMLKDIGLTRADVFSVAHGVGQRHD
jgi:uncharacterized protein YjiS (DUF1127 family)